MKKITILTLVLVSMLGCLTGCKETNASSSQPTQPIDLTIEVGPAREDVARDVSRFLSGRGYGLTRYCITQADYDSTTDTCVVTLAGTVFPLDERNIDQTAAFRFTYKRSTDGSWEKTWEYPEVLSGYLPKRK